MAEFIFALSPWLTMRYESLVNGLQIIIGLQDQADNRRGDKAETQLAWMLAKAAGRAMVAVDLWVNMSFNYIQAAEAFAASPRDAIANELRVPLGYLSYLDGELPDGITMTGPPLRTFMVVREFGWTVNKWEADALANGEKGHQAAQILARYRVSVRFELFVNRSQAVEVIRARQRIWPVLGDETISFIARKG